MPGFVPAAVVQADIGECAIGELEQGRVRETVLVVEHTGLEPITGASGNIEVAGRYPRIVDHPLVRSSQEFRPAGVGRDIDRSTTAVVSTGHLDQLPEVPEVAGRDVLPPPQHAQLDGLLSGDEQRECHENRLRIESRPVRLSRGRLGPWRERHRDVPRQSGRWV
jgi:hypothetical protein